MNKTLQGVAAVVLGLFSFMVVLAVSEAAGHALFTMPPGLDSPDTATRNQAFEAVPVGAKLAVLVAWAVGTLVGSCVAARIAPVSKLSFGLAIGVIGICGALATMLMIPHPVWMWVFGLVEFLPIAYLGYRLAAFQRARPSGVPPVSVVS